MLRGEEDYRMNNFFYYSIICILLAGFLCGGILGSILIRKMAQMKEMIHTFCLTERQSRNQHISLSQPIELTQEERSMLLEDKPAEDTENDDSAQDQLMIEEFLQEILSC